MEAFPSEGNPPLSKNPALPHGAPHDGTGFFPKLLLDRVHAHPLAVLAHPFETDGAVRFGEQGVVRSDTDVQAGMDGG